MNQLLRSNRPATLRFSTDPTAASLSRFTAERFAMPYRPAAGDTTPNAAAPLDLPVLYPSLYAERVSLAGRCRAYLDAIGRELRLPSTSGSPRTAIDVGSKR